MILVAGHTFHCTHFFFSFSSDFTGLLWQMHFPADKKGDTDVDTEPVVLGICTQISLFLLFSKCLNDVVAMCVIVCTYHIHYIYVCVCISMHIHTLMC